MKLTDHFIKRPVFATVLSLVILLVGIMSYMRLTVRQFPEIDASVITISTTYPGASANLMEGFVTTPIESAIAGVDGIDYVTSSSSKGSSAITVHFKLGYNINTAVTDISDKVSSVRSSLPDEINDPIISKQDPNATPIMFIGFSSSELTPEAISDYLVRVVQPQLETLDGVGEAKIFGDRTYAMRLWLNPIEMAAHDITATEVQQALNANNVQSAAGTIKGDWQQFDVNAKTDLNSPQAFNDMVIKDVNGQIIQLKDIGHAELGPASTDSSFVLNGKKAVVIGIIPKSTANPLEVAKEVRAELSKLNAEMPKDLKSSIMYDASRFIQSSIDEVYRTIIEATLLVILVIFLFIGSIRATFIPIVTIPLSLIGVCALMLAMGFSINTLTLLAWVLAIGMVVDDAIVVSENVHRHIEMGKPSIAAAIFGAREIRFAVMAMTFTLAAVYAPIGFLTGLTGSLFREFAFTLAAAVIISGFIALTLSPMMCSRFLKHNPSEKSFAAKVDKFFNRIKLSYKILLTKVLNKRFLIISIAILVYISCYFLYKMTPQELAPREDQGVIITFMQGPASSNINFTEKYTSELEKIYATIPETESYGIISGFPQGVNSGLSFLILKPWDKRKKTAAQITEYLFPKLMMIPGIQAFPSSPPSLPGSSGFNPVEFVLKTTGSYDQLEASMNKLMEAAHKFPGFINLNSDLKIDKPEIDINIDRNKAGSLGIPMSEIAQTLNMLLGQPTVTHFDLNGRSYDVIPQINLNFQKNPYQLNDVYVKSLNGALVPLANIVNISQSVGPRSLNHFQQMRSATLQASVTPGYTLGEDLSYLENVAKQILPGDVSIDFAGESRQFIETSGQMLQIFGFALIFIYLILAAQFESFRDPFIVMLSVPLATAGAILTMLLTKSTMNIYTEIGLVTLIGLISKHGILIVEFANQIQDKGKNKFEAVIESASIRLRPILMTTAAMILGALPLALASGAGSEARKQLGWTIIGGMGFGTMLTLFVVPVAYTLIAKKRKIFTSGDKALDQELLAD